MLSMWSVLTWGAVIVALAVAVYLLLRERVRATGETKMVAMVRRRRELTQRLHDLAGESSSELARLEAKRQGDASTSIAVLEAAVQRAEKLYGKAPEASRATR